MSMLDALRERSAVKYLFKVVEEEVALHAKRDLGSARVGTLEYGQVALLCDVSDDGWARLHDDQIWAMGSDLEGRASGEAGPVFVLIDGRSQGLPRYLKRENASLEDWEYSEAVKCAEANGVTWKKVPGGLSPKGLIDLAWLSPWHMPDGTLAQAPPLLHNPARYMNLPLPRLCVASMVRGARAEALESLILLHHRSGFERVVLYFDKPDPDEAEAVAAVEKFARPVPTGPDGLLCTARAVLCTESWWKEARRNSRYYQRREEPLSLYRDTVELDSEVRDVQARQMLVAEHALFEAQRERFQWLLHVDADEVLFLPDEERHPDARKFFYEVPEHFTSVRFANLEAVPEAPEVADPFRDVTLFKMNPALLQELGVEPRILADGEVAPEDEEREEDLFDSRHADAVPGGYSHGWVRIPRRERHALRRLLAVMHDIAAKRAPVLKGLGVELDPVQYPAREEDSDDDWSDDESCYGPRPHCPAYFNSYSNGKCAVRTEVGPRGEYPPLPAGVHGFLRDGGQVLYTLLCKGPGAPVVLHYSNCGLGDWRKKYQILCRGHGTDDGAFSTTREGISEVRSHMATRQLTLRSDDAELETFYRNFVMGNEFDELAYLAQFGLVLRLQKPQALLKEARARFRAAGASSH